MTEIELVDAQGDIDEWHTDAQASQRRIGNGSGRWFVRRSNKQVLLLDENSGSVEATLQYERRWPPRAGDEGTVFLRSPLRQNASRLLNYVVHQVL